MLYSIVETAKANGLILYDYMVKCMKELAKAEPDIDALLPWNFKHQQYHPVGSWGGYNPLGADASALLYSIIETAKANGLILYDYMVKCMKELAKSEPDIDSLLPWNFSH